METRDPPRSASENIPTDRRILNHDWQLARLGSKDCDIKLVHIHKNGMSNEGMSREKARKLAGLTRR